MGYPEDTTPTESGQVQGADPNTGQDGAVQPKELTYEVVQDMIAKGNEETFRRSTGIMDSKTDKTNNAVQAELTKITKTVESLRASGEKISPQAEQNLKNEAMQKVFMEQGQTEGDNQQEAAGPPQDIHPITAEGFAMMDRTGINIDDSDPEASTLVHDKGGYEYLESMRKAIEAKRVRLGDAATEEQPGQTRLPTSAVTHGKQTTPNFMNMDDGEIFKKAFYD